eukprot:7171555-Pyramimonas_sp.AAC.1
MELLKDAYGLLFGLKRLVFRIFHLAQEVHLLQLRGIDARQEVVPAVTHPKGLMLITETQVLPHFKRARASTRIRAALVYVKLIPAT